MKRSRSDAGSWPRSAAAADNAPGTRLESSSFRPIVQTWSRYYYLFRHLKSHLRGIRFGSNEELKSFVETWFEGQPEFYLDGIDSLRAK